MRVVRAGDTYRDAFSIQSSTGAAAAADSLPTAVVYKNGASDGTVTVTITSVATGAYTVSFVVPVGYAAGDIVQALVTAVIGGVTVVGWSSPVTVAGFPATALPNAAAGANGGLPVLSSSATTLAYTVSTATNLTNLPTAPTDWLTALAVKADAVTKIQAGLSTYAGGDTTGTTTLLARLTAARSGYIDNLSGGAVATAAQVISLQVNTRANLNVPVEIETPDAGTQVYKVRLHLFDVEGNMEAPDSTPTVALTNAAGTDRSGRLSAASNPSTGVYTWDYTATAGDAEEQLVWVFTVVEGGLTRTYPATSYVVEETAYRFSATDRATLAAVNAKTANLPSDPAGLANLAAAHGAGSWLTATGFVLAASAPSWYTAPVDVSANVAAIKAKTDNLPTAPAAVADVPTAAAITSAVAAQITTDHGAGSYIRNTEPDNTTLTRLATTLETPGLGVYRFTTAALINAPTGGGGTADWTDPEREQIRKALGVTGTAAATTGAGILDLVKAKMDTLGAGQVTVFSPVSVAGDRVELRRGDDYLAADGRALDFIAVGWPDLTGATVAFVLHGVSRAGSIPVHGSGSQTVRWEPTAAVTAVLRSGTMYAVATLADGDIMTLLSARVDVS